MTGTELAAAGILAPLLLALTATLYRVGTVMGRLEQKLDDHDTRLVNLESALPRGGRGYAGPHL